MRKPTPKSLLTNANATALASQISRKASAWASDIAQGIGDGVMPSDGRIAHTMADRFCGELEALINRIRFLAGAERDKA